jgi:hypothetical protein
LRGNSVERVDLELDVSRRLHHTCFKGRLETVSPRESTELQRKWRFRERIYERTALDGAEVGAGMLQIHHVLSQQYRDREKFDGG